MAPFPVAKAVRFDCNGRCLHWVVDVLAGHIWVEEKESKCQWEWREPAKERQDQAGELIPQKVVLETLQGLLTGRSLASTGRVALKERDNQGLCLTVFMKLEATRWEVKRSFELTPLVLSASDLAFAQHLETLRSLETLENRLEAALYVLGTMRLEQQAARATLAPCCGSTPFKSEMRLLLVLVIALFAALNVIRYAT